MTDIRFALGAEDGGGEEEQLSLLHNPRPSSPSPPTSPSLRRSEEMEDEALPVPSELNERQVEKEESIAVPMPDLVTKSLSVSASAPTVSPKPLGSPSSSDWEDEHEPGDSGLWFQPSSGAERDPHKILVELYDLDWHPITGQSMWQETARWIKYEEDAEGVDHGHWGRPHVAFLSFHALHQLKACLKNGLIMLDLEAGSFDEACEKISEAMAHKFGMDERRTAAVLATLTRKHRHVHTSRLPRIPSKARKLREQSVADFRRQHSASTAAVTAVNFDPGHPQYRRTKSAFHSDHPFPEGKLEKGMPVGRSMSPPNLATLAEEEDWPDVEVPPRKVTSGARVQWALGEGDVQDDDSVFHHDDTAPHAVVGSGAGGLDPLGLRGLPDRDRGLSFMSTRTNASTKSGMGAVRLGLGAALQSIRSMHRIDSVQDPGAMSPADVQELMSKIPDGAESAQVFVGVLKELKDARFCMVRLKDGVIMRELLDAPVPIRFLIVLLGPSLDDVNYHEIGRSIATLMSNPHFHSIAYSAHSAKSIDTAIDDFLDGSIVIPPGEIDSKQLLSVDEIKKALRRRKSRVASNRERLNRRHVKSEDFPYLWKERELRVGVVLLVERSQRR